jgi:hypothetical protein
LERQAYGLAKFGLAESFLDADGVKRRVVKQKARP